MPSGWAGITPLPQRGTNSLLTKIKETAHKLDNQAATTNPDAEKLLRIIETDVHDTTLVAVPQVILNHPF
jgi:hypothetical protein